MAIIKGRYPHDHAFHPLPMKAPALWSFAEVIRRQVLGVRHRCVPDIRDVARRTETVEINGLAYSLIWDFENPVHDEDGHPVMGVCDYDPDTPGQVMVSVNGPRIGDHPELARSTALHELGHALFDMPSAVYQGRQVSLGEGALGVEKGQGRTSQQAMDWREWRANEFMGAFLAPPVPFHRQLVQVAQQAHLPLVYRPSLGKYGLPVVNGHAVCWGAYDEAVDLLAETFGVTAEFAKVRIAKYRLLAGLEG